jgi:hypothetical protein
MALGFSDSGISHGGLSWPKYNKGLGSLLLLASPTHVLTSGTDSSTTNEDEKPNPKDAVRSQEWNLTKFKVRVRYVSRYPADLLIDPSYGQSLLASSLPQSSVNYSV